MSGKHTPAPWRRIRAEDDRENSQMPCDYWYIDAGAGHATGDNGFGLTGWMYEPDARLIQAAPELLDELETLCQAIEGHRAGSLNNDGLWHYAEKAVALIAKVRRAQ